MTRTTLALLVTPVVLLASFVTACGDDGQGFRATDICPEQPIYRYVSDGGVWVRIAVDGQRLTAAEQAPIALAEAPPTGKPCLTKAGTALPIDRVDAGN